MTSASTTDLTRRKAENVAQAAKVVQELKPSVTCTRTLTSC